MGEEDGVPRRRLGPPPSAGCRSGRQGPARDWPRGHAIGHYFGGGMIRGLMP